MRNRGMLWKTPWKRRKPVVTPYPVSMWFFTNFGVPGSGFFPNSIYQFAALSPATGESGPPFWVGLVGAIAEPVPVGPDLSAYVGQGGSANTGNWGLGSTGSSASTDITTESYAAGASASYVSPSLGATVRAVVSLATFTSDGTNTTVRLWVDGFPVAQEVATIVPPAPGLVFMGASSPEYIHGWAGGNVLPTNDEIRAWFKATKANLEIAEIPGKTLDRFSATSVQPLAPNPLPTLGTGQSMSYVTPVGPDPGILNSYINVSFGY